MATQKKGRKRGAANAQAASLLPDQFTVNEQGELIIQQDELAQQIANAPTPSDDPPEQGGISVSLQVE
ncbi:hypothetical protein F8S13_04830 [Chloroflexia bacterium SDU3-3]|nr:hypothetical protein F8S13_04830 [Chloroflexia bacterium SDU3-3]